MLSLLPHKFAPPKVAAWLPDEPETWEILLSNPQTVATDEERDAAEVLCGARYFPEAEARDKENVEDVTCLVLDVDVPGKVPDAATLREMLSGLRHVVYASPSHTTANPRWRVLLPLLKPLPPKMHRALVAIISEQLGGAVDVEQTGDPCRLGFVGVTKHPEDYVWWSEPGPYLDWTPLPLVEETWAEGPLTGLDRSPLWLDRASALRAAKRAHALKGQGLRKGEGRTSTLFNVALSVWWGWAAEDENFVFEVLQEVNRNFRDPEHDDELWRQVKDAYRRTIGERRHTQVAGEYGFLRLPSNTITPETIAAHGRRLCNRQRPEEVLIGRALRRLADGETLSDDIETWPGLVTKCAHELARAFSSQSADRIAGFFRASLAAMRQTGAMGVPHENNVRAYIENTLERVGREREELRAREDAKLKEDIEFVTSGARSTKYTRDEFEMWHSTVGLTDKTWILVAARGAYFVFRNGSWVGPYSKEQMEPQVYRELAAAQDFVRLRYFVEKTGEFKDVPFKDLVKQYGSACTTVIDMSCERSWFDVDKQQLVLAGPKRRPLEAKFHPAVDTWLRIACGRALASSESAAKKQAGTVPLLGEYDDYDVVCDWLASILHLDRPCSALYLEGPHSTGKGLFADGVARLWMTGAIGLVEAFVGFNNLLSETPLIWIDEGLPEHVQVSTLLRRALALREHIYKRKNLDDGKVLGCVRLLFTSNNLDLFQKSKELLSKQDVDALSLRFAHVHMRDAAADYLRAHPEHRDFVERNMLAEHALWLEQKRWPAIDARSLRFLVAGKNTLVSDVVATSDDVVSDVCSEVCTALLSLASAQGGAMAIRGSTWIRVKDGNVHVHVTQLKQQLSLRQTRYTDREVARAVDSISAGDAIPMRDQHTSKVQKMRPLRPEALYAWVSNTKVYDWEDIVDAICVLDPSSHGPEGGGSGNGNASSNNSGNGVGSSAAGGSNHVH